MVSINTGKKDIAVTKEFHKWLRKKQRWSEPSLEDTLRRLIKFKPRKEKKK